MSPIALIITLIAAANALAVPGWGPHHWPGSGSYSSWNLERFTSLVVFGDSYSDDSRLGYFIENNGSAPPVGWVDPVVRISEARVLNAHTDHISRTMLLQMAAESGVNTSNNTPARISTTTLFLAPCAATTLRRGFSL
jgi:hypothetical protein